MLHRGEMLKSAIKDSGIPISRVVLAVGKSRRWLYNQFEKTDVPLDVLIEIGKIIHHDFSLEIPELRKRNPESTRKSNSEDPDTHYPEHDAEYWKDKYLRLLEEYTDLLKRR